MAGHTEPFTQGEAERMAAALWNIRMAAETSSINDPPWVLPNWIKMLVEGGLGARHSQAQRLAAERRDPRWRSRLD